jgi:very-short-patch-repair endonuclease
MEIRIIKKHKTPTAEATALKNALEELGLIVEEEVDDGHKTIDLSIPEARIDIEVDGLHHLTNPNQILSDLSRGHFSHKDGFATMHIQNEMIRRHLKPIAEALAEASKIRERKILHIHVD